MRSSHKTVSVDALQVGSELQSAIYDESETKLVGAGVKITLKLLLRLKERGIERISVAREDFTKLRGGDALIDSNPPHESEDNWNAPAQSDSELPEQGNRELVAVIVLGRRIAAGGDAASLLHEAAVMCADTLNTDRAAVAVSLPENQSVAFRVVTRAVKGRLPKPKMYELGEAEQESLSAYTIGQMKPVIVNDLAEDSRFTDDLLASFDVKSALVTPLVCQGAARGTLGVYSAMQREFSGSDSLFLEAIGHLIASVVPAAASCPPFLIDKAADAEHSSEQSEEEDEANRRQTQRFEYNVAQSMAPMINGIFPDEALFAPVRMRDISVGGFSFTADEEPEHKDFVVSLGKPPSVKYVKAEIKNCRLATVDGRSMYIIGCAFGAKIDRWRPAAD